jgi:hypothetical protein
MYIYIITQWRNSPPVGQGLLIIEASRSHSDTPHSVGFFCMSDQVDAETSTWHYVTIARQASMFWWDSNPQSQKASGYRPTSYTARPLGSANVCTRGMRYIFSALKRAFKFKWTAISLLFHVVPAKIKAFVTPWDKLFYSFFLEVRGFLSAIALQLFPLSDHFWTSDRQGFASQNSFDKNTIIKHSLVKKLYTT